MGGYVKKHHCEYYPCHDGEDMSCLFCYCPLYRMKDCGGNYKILPGGIKDCSDCLLPHQEENYVYILLRLYEDQG
ncbi:MAG TPA: metal-binding protein [Syntrophomonadaceae bacterium]|nr:metal-binding protein [Syntrophomonadaceae bacterium]